MIFGECFEEVCVDLFEYLRIEAPVGIGCHLGMGAAEEGFGENCPDMFGCAGSAVAWPAQNQVPWVLQSGNIPSYTPSIKRFCSLS